MQVTETSAEGLKREFRIVVPAGELEEKVTSRLGEIGQTINLPGFRRGKVPMQILRRRFGTSVLGEVLESAVQGSSADAISNRRCMTGVRRAGSKGAMRVMTSAARTAALSSRGMEPWPQVPRTRIR